MFGKELNRKSRATRAPVGLVGVYVNNTDMWSWSPMEAVTSECARNSLINHTDARGHYNGMLYPLFNMSAKGAIFSEVRQIFC